MGTTLASWGKAGEERKLYRLSHVNRVGGPEERYILQKRTYRDNAIADTTWREVTKAREFKEALISLATELHRGGEIE